METLQKSKDYLNTLLDSVTDAIFSVSVPGRCIEFANQAVYDMFGYRPDEVIGQNTRMFYPDDASYEGFGKAVTNALECGRPQIRMEQVLLRKNGQRLWTEIHTTFRFSNDQLSQIISVIRDISGRKQSEKELRESEGRYRRLVEGSPAILYAFSDKRGAVYYSARVQSILGHCPEHLLNHPMLWHDSIHPDDLPQIDQAIAKLGEGEDFDLEYRIQDAQGNWHWFRDRSIGLKKEGGETIVEGLASDITDLKRIEAALRQKIEQMVSLYTTSLEITSPHDLSALLQTIVERAACLLKGSGGGMYLCDPDQKTVRCVVSYNTPSDYTGTVLKFGEGAAGIVAKSGKPLVVEDYRTWRKRANVYDEEQPFTAVLSVPMTWQGEVIGVIHVLHDIEDQSFNQEDVELLTLFASQAAVAIISTRLFDTEQQLRIELERKNRLVNTLSQVSTRIQTVRSSADVMKILGTELKKMGFNCSIALFDESDPALVMRYSSLSSRLISTIERILKQPIPGFRLTPATFPPYTELVENNCPIFASPEDTITYAMAAIPGFAKAAIQRILKLAGIQSDTSAFFLPLMFENHLLGALWLWGKNLREADMPIFMTFASQLSIIIENTRLFDQVLPSRERLQVLSHRLVEIQENERRRIALELHDEIGQSLTVLSLLLNSHPVASMKSEKGMAELQNARELIDEISDKVQDLSLNLRPSMLDDLGLLPTLVWYIGRYSQQVNIEIDFEHVGLERRFPPDIETTAYRIIQEALTNVTRYAEVKQAFVRVWAEDKINIQIEDNGVGFDPIMILEHKETIGVIGMRERADQVGGKLDILSSPGGGTTVIAILPLEGKLERRKYER